MSTKESILLTSINLFNLHGTAKVTTNHIAKEASISPGNLYYHYKDKAHIIREIYELMIHEWETVYEEVEKEIVFQDKLLIDFVQANFEMLWKYRFFNRETVALLNADPLLSQRYIEVTNARFIRQRLILQKAVDQGFLRFPEPEIYLDEILTITWIVANHYLLHLEAMGQKVEKQDFKAGAVLVMKVLFPYLNRK